MKKILTSLFSLLLVCLVATSALAQGTTTSSISGEVLDENGEPVIGAVVKAIHEPSGTTYGGVTQVDGNYIIPNTRVGGPYKITASYVGYNDQTVDNVYLQLGKRFNQDIRFDSAATDLEAVVVVGDNLSAGQSNGVSNQITTEQIETLPTVNRDLNDFTRTTPEASTAAGGISFAGLNNRYNAVYFDGAVNNDMFGLASDGTNGGQIGISPISVDAIDQLQVVVSPYDVTLGGFAGGGINAVTRSGTNKFKGSAYYYWQNEKLAGKTNDKYADRYEDGERERLSDFSEKVYGFRLGGPIIKNKLFFFANTEFQKNETPYNFNLDAYEGNTDAAGVESLRNYVMDTYDYDPGSFSTFGEKLDGTKILGKIDYNINENNKLMARYSYVKGKLDGRGGSSYPSRLYGANNRQYFPSTTNSATLEWNFNKNNFANNLTLGYTNVNDNRDPLGSPFPYVEIDDGGRNSIRFGSEPFSTANLLKQSVFTLTDNFNLYKGDHTLTFGTHNEFGKFTNVFIPQNYGAYYFDSVQDFYNGIANQVRRSYSIVDDGAIGDASTNAAAKFNTTQLGFYIQDEWVPNNNVTVTGGLRLDIPFFNQDPGLYEDFATTTKPNIQNAGWSIINSVRDGKAPKAQLMLSPRLGFNWTPEEIEDLTIKGGLGIFTSRIPFVWPGAMYSTNGLKQGGISERGNIPFVADVDEQPTQATFGGQDAVPAGDLNLFVEDFKYPQVFRTSLGFAKEFKGGWNWTMDGIYTKTLNNVVYQSVNFANAYTSTPGPESRLVYESTSAVDSRYRDIYVGYNTSEGKSYNFSTGLNKSFDNFFGSIFYSYGDSYALNEATSSQNSSQWRGQVNSNAGRNNPVFGRSDFSAGSRFVLNGSYKFEYGNNDDFATTFGVFYNGQSGTPFSWVVGGSGARNLANEGGSSGRNRSLFYVPETINDIQLEATDDFTVEQQWNLLDKFIRDDKYLKNHRGEFVGKNSNRLPWENQFDLKILQDFGVTVNGTKHRLQLSADIFNFGNLLNKKWGATWSTNNEFTFQNVLDFRGYDGDGRPVYRFEDEATGDDRFNVNDVSSRWRAQLGVRYIFE